MRKLIQKKSKNKNNKSNWINTLLKNNNNKINNSKENSIIKEHINKNNNNIQKNTLHNISINIINSTDIKIDCPTLKNENETSLTD